MTKHMHIRHIVLLAALAIPIPHGTTQAATQAATQPVSALDDTARRSSTEPAVLSVNIRRSRSHDAAMFVAAHDVRGCAFTHDGAVIAATAGGLWLGSGPLLTAQDGLPDTQIDSLHVAGDTVSIQTPSGRAQVSLATRKVLAVDTVVIHQSAKVPDFDRFQGSRVNQRVQQQTAAGHRTCIATDQGLHLALESAEPSPVAIEGASIPSSNIAALQATRDHGVFIGTFDRGLLHLNVGSIEQVSSAVINPNINALAWDESRKLLWIATARGLVRCEVTMNCQRVGDGAPKHTVLLLTAGALAGSVAFGGDGSLAFASAEGKLREATTHKSGAPFRAVWALAESADGTLYAGTTNGLWFGKAEAFLDSRALRRASMVDGTLPDDWVTAVATRGSEVVVGTYNAGLVRFEHSDDRLVRTGSQESAGYINPAGIVMLPHRQIAIATMDGLHVGTWGSLRKVATLGSDVTAISRESGGRRWVASRRGLQSF